MKKLFPLLATTGAVGVAGLSAGLPVQANEPVPTDVDRLGTQIRRLTGRDAMSQVTSISQLSDVRPTDWAFTALQSLVERYNCIAGYPDRTYRGNQAMTRYEFAAGLNACLDKINEIIASGLADKVSKEDLATLQKLQEEFAAELATLRGRVDTLESKVATLEAQQFSTTTKLEGQGIIAFSGATNQNTVAVARSRLTLNTSFTGKDQLVTQLTAGTAYNGNNLSYGSEPNTFGLSTLRYSFPVGRDIEVAVGAVLTPTDFFDTNSFANSEVVDFSNGVFLNNPLTVAVGNGAGVFAKYTPNQGALYISALYYAGNASITIPGGNPTGGLFGENNQFTVELGFTPKDRAGNIPFALKLQYTRATLDGTTGPSVFIGSPSTLDAFGANLEWTFARGAALFGRFGIAGVRNNSGTPSLTPIYWKAGFAFPDLFKEGALAAVAVAQPQANLGTPATQTNLELFYNYPISDNIRITPDIQFIFNPGNLSANTIFVGTLRTVFSF